MFGRMNWGWASLLSLAVVAAASPALAGSGTIQGVGYGAHGTAMGLALLGAGAAVGGLLAYYPRLLSPVVFAAIAIAVLVPVFAVAQVTAAPPVSETTFTLPWGDMLASFSRTALEILLPILSTAILAGAARLPWWITMWLTTGRIDRALATGADYAINAVEGAVHGKALNVDVGYKVLKVGLERIMGSTPDWLIKELGGAKGITERLFRVMRFDETVTDKNTLQKVLDDLPTFPFVKAA